MFKQVIEQKTFRTPDGLNLFADVGGSIDAPAVILAHGGGQTRHSWSGAMQRLMDAGYYVVNYDARGHGESDWSPDGVYSMQASASDLKAVVNSLPSPPALVGASMGGIAGFMAIGTSDPAMARALVLVDVAVRNSMDGQSRILGFMSGNPDGFATLDEVADAVSAYTQRPRPRNPEGLLKNLRKRNGRVYWHWDPQMIKAAQGPDPIDPMSMMAEVSDKVTVPTLLVRGGSSDVVTQETVTDMQQRLPHVEVYEVPGAGHMVAGDRNDAFNQGIIDFLRRHHPV